MLEESAVATSRRSTATPGREPLLDASRRSHVDAGALKTRAPRIGLAIATIGRAELTELLRSIAESSVLPEVVGIGNQSGGPLGIDVDRLPFEVVVVPSSGGASQARNDAVGAIAAHVDVLGFPNDDSLLPPTTLAEVSEAFTDESVDAVAFALVEFGATRFVLPPTGTDLNARSVWRAIEQTTYLRADAFESLQGFRTDIGTGSAGPWQSGEITDLLLRLLENGGRLVSRPDVEVIGRGEKRDLSDRALIAKHRRYARGTGYVYRVHPYRTEQRLMTVAGPWRHPFRHHVKPGVSLRLAVARSVGRVEGLIGRTLTGRR